MLVRRQGLGMMHSKQASDLRVGDVLIWNFGFQYEVVSIAERGKTQLVVTERSCKTGETYERVMRKTTAVVTRDSAAA